jgi:prepilin-type N-terminal cleavage/methylation domain-containing protein
MKGWFIFNRACANIVTRSSLRGAGGSGSLMSAAMKTHPVKSQRISGFSLIELLAVMAVVAVMTSLLLPSISGLSGTAGRRGAVNTVMNTLEQARVSAVESSRPVYVVFWRRVFPESDALMVLRESDSGTGNYEQLTRWIKLPKGVLLHQPAVGQSVLSLDPAAVLDQSRMPNRPTLGTGESINAIVFNETGGVSFPTTKANRKLIISEGIRGEGGTEALLSAKKQTSGGFEIISLSRYTGRSQLDVSAVQ